MPVWPTVVSCHVILGGQLLRSVPVLLTTLLLAATQGPRPRVLSGAGCTQICAQPPCASRTGLHQSPKQERRREDVGAIMTLYVISTQPSWNGIPPPTFLWGVFISASGFWHYRFWGGGNTQIDIFFFPSKLIVNLIKVSSSLKNSVALVPFFSAWKNYIF